MNNAYNYFGDTITSVADTDIISQIESIIGKQITIKQITMISASAFTFNMNGGSWANTVYEDVDSRHKVSLTDVTISKINIIEYAIDIFVAVLF